MSSPRYWHSLDTVDWWRVSIFVAAVSTFWATMIAVIPDPYAKWVTTFLLGVSNAVALMLRSGKSRVEKIEEKIEDHQADAVQKTEEIKNLIVSEVQEKAEKLEEKK